jgi:hypothetical protein
MDGSESMSYGISASGQYNGVQASGSVDGSNDWKASSKTNTRTAYKDTDLEYYTLDVKPNDIQGQYAPEFQRQVDRIQAAAEGTETRKTAWRRLFNAHGTHFVSSVRVGGQVRMVATFVQTLHETETKNALDAAMEVATAEPEAPGGERRWSLFGRRRKKENNGEDDDEEGEDDEEEGEECEDDDEECEKKKKKKKKKKPTKKGSVSGSFGKAQSVAKSKGLQDVSVKFVCTGGDPSVCNDETESTPDFILTVKENPEMFESHILPIAHVFPEGDLRFEAKQEVEAFWKAKVEACPTAVAGKVCSNNGVCIEPDEYAISTLSNGAQCHCNEGFLGKDCNIKAVGSLPERPDKPGMVKFKGRKGETYVDACQANERKCWNLQQAPIDNSAIFVNSGCDLVGFDLPTGVAVTAYNMWPGWGPGCNDNGGAGCFGRGQDKCWFAADSANPQQAGEAMMKGYTTSVNKDCPHCNAGKGNFLGYSECNDFPSCQYNVGRDICGWQLFLMPGYACGN